MYRQAQGYKILACELVQSPSRISPDFSWVQSPDICIYASDICSINPNYFESQDSLSSLEARYMYIKGTKLTFSSCTDKIPSSACSVRCRFFRSPNWMSLHCFLIDVPHSFTVRFQTFNTLHASRVIPWTSSRDYRWTSNPLMFCDIEFDPGPRIPWIRVGR
jgi:hypothetical protein